MLKKIVAFDVESPNSHQNSICSIAFVVYENGEIVQNFHSLINPQAPFDEKCIKIHSITAADTKSAPTLLDIWDEIEEFFTKAIVVGHNISGYDLPTLAKALNNSGIFMPDVHYIDTYRLAQKYHSKNFLKLNHLCEEFEIPLIQHHNALADATACLDLLLKLENLYKINLENEIHYFDFSPLDDVKKPTIYSGSTMKMQEMKGMARGVLLDNVVTDAEVVNFKKWLDENEELTGYYPFDKILSICDNILFDGIITNEEKETLFTALDDFANPAVLTEHAQINVDFANNTFCLTGHFSHGSKDEIKEKICRRGGICRTSVSKKTNYLIVGNIKNENWKFGDYGEKVNKALELQEGGSDIKILHEDDFFEMLVSNNGNS